MRELTQVQRMQLASVVAMPGYKVLLDVMELEREKAVTELLRVDPANRDAIVASHNTARAFAVFFERVQKAAMFEVNEGLNDVEQAQPQSVSEEQFVRQTINPIL